jgi:hypothetical protein
VSGGLTIAVIRKALADQIRQNMQRDFTVRPYPPRSSGPSITVVAANDFLDYWVTYSAAGLARVRLDLIIDPAGSDIESSHRRLDDVLSAGAGNGSSVIDALMVDTTLGGVVDVAHIQSVSVDTETITAVASVEIHVNKVDG